MTLDRALEIIDTCCQENNMENYIKTPNEDSEINSSAEDMSGSTKYFSFKPIHTEGGFEGAGTYICIVYMIVDNAADIGYLKLEGRYDSWDGSYYYADTLKMVYPIQKTITVYE